MGSFIIPKGISTTVDTTIAETALAASYTIADDGAIVFNLETLRLRVYYFSDMSFHNISGNTVTDYRSSYEIIDGKVYSGYYFNTFITIIRVINGIIENATGLTNLETDWNNRLALSYI